MRSFIGIKVPENEKITSFQNELKNRFRIKLVEAENLHITLKFLGEIDEKNLDKIIKALRMLEFEKFKVIMKGAGAFPKENNARVIWIGLISKELNDLGETVSTILKNYGDEKFSPHLTVGRLKTPENTIEVLSKYKNFEFGNIIVESFEIYKSTLTPQGPLYEEIEKFPGR
ncbi:MAG: RNA 2',3'-cyclic phosphodiesterase [Thermoplasmata archaeon]|mgnify:CR=1 FL=1|nr:RNA 2',3'-cyclic phosphodiesterase [Thermoplasmata archaeon]